MYTDEKLCVQQTYLVYILAFQFYVNFMDNKSLFMIQAFIWQILWFSFFWNLVKTCIWLNI